MARSVTRRDFLRLSAMGGVVALATACGAAPPAAPTVAPAVAATAAPAAVAPTVDAAAANAAAAQTVVAMDAAAADATATAAAAAAPPPTTAPAAGATTAPPVDPTIAPAAAATTAPAASDAVNFTNPGASTAAPAVVTQKGGKLIIGSGGTFEQSDPQRVFDLQNLLTQRLWTAGLLDYDDQLIPMPGIMDKWAISDDGLTYTFHLRDGVKWTNGRAITIEDIVWNLNRFVDLKGVSSSGASFLFMPKEGIKAIDASTVQITLTQPFAPFLSAMACSYSAFLIAPESPMAEDVVTLAIGTGPYELLEYKPKEIIRLKLFKDNFRGMTDGFDEIDIVNLADDAVRINALQAGDVDFIILVPESEIQRLKTEQQGQIDTFISREGIFWWFPFNPTREPFTDPAVRQAIRLAFNAQEVTDGVTLGEGAAYEEPFVSGSRWHFPPPAVPQRDAAAAKAALAAAGFPDGLSLKLLISSSWYSSMTAASQVLQAQLAEAGIAVEIENVEFGTFFDRAGKLDYDMMLSGWEVEPWDPDDYYFNCHMPDQSQWWYGGAYNNADMQALVKQARGEPEFEKRKALYQQVETIMQDDVAGLFGYRLTMGFAWRSNLKGFIPSLRGDVAQVSGGIFTMTKT